MAPRDDAGGRRLDQGAPAGSAAGGADATGYGGSRCDCPPGRAEADRVLQPDRLIWVVVGDREHIEESIRDLDLGETRFLDAHGNPVEG